MSTKKKKKSSSRYPQGRESSLNPGFSSTKSAAAGKNETPAKVPENPQNLKEKDPNPEPIRVLYISPEVVPFSGTGGLSEVAGSLPKAVNADKDHPIECRVISPLYKSIEQKYRSKMEFLGYTDIPVSWRSKYMGVFRLKLNNTIYYFIDNEEYFRRDDLYGYFDDCERFAFFCRAVFESMSFTGYFPDILHANDWQSAMVPVYQDALYHLKYTTTIFTIHNIEYQGQYGNEVIGDVLGLPDGAAHLVEFGDHVNLMKGGIETANVISTVSPTYAQELKTPEFAFGLDGMIRANENKLKGILNGIDTHAYDPSSDPAICAPYSALDLEGKIKCKEDLQKSLMLPTRKDVPLVAVISRLVSHKGFDLVRDAIDNLLYNSDIQFILLGTGDHSYEDFFRSVEQRHPERARSMIMFNRDLSHRIYAGADILLMPSKSEPCGLSQMIACRYGCIPVVHRTGGLADSIRDCTLGDGSGFVFDQFTLDSMNGAIRNALALYRQPENWKNLVRHDMHLDFSWNSAAREYIELYRTAKWH